jgi:hypothetical protein
LRQISKGILRKARAQTIRDIGPALERTAWGQGGHIVATSKNGRRTDHRVVASWPGARPSQIRAGAKKLFDVMAAEVRRAEKAEAQQ